jgi:hypothetical protein
MIIKDLKDKYPLVYEAAIKNCNTGCNENDAISSAFTWENTPEGNNFWWKIDDERFDEAKEICPHLFTKSPEEFKEGDWVYAERQDNEDYRYSEHIPVFQIKDFNSTKEYLRPVESSCSGVHMKHCRKATQAEIDKATGIKSDSFILPKKWCVKVTNENQDIIGKWRTNGSCNVGGYCMYSGYNDVDGYWDSIIPDGITEITFEQFKQYVLKDSTNTKIKVKKPQQPGLTNTTGVNMKDIQAEAKRRFPIGCEFLYASAIEYKPRRLIQDDHVYRIVENMIYASNSLGCLYIDGQWASLISMPETVVDEDPLITEAKRRYPVGTHFMPAHTNDGICIITEDCKFDKIDGNNIYSRIITTNQVSSSDKKYGNTGYNRVVYYNGKWAQVVGNQELEPVKSIIEEYPYKVGDNIVVKRPKPKVISVDSEVKIKVNYKPQIKIS